MSLAENLSLACAALAIEAAFGYPPALYRRIGHPVTWIGALIAASEARINRLSDPPAISRLKGALEPAFLARRHGGGDRACHLALPGLAAALSPARAPRREPAGAEKPL